MKSMGYEQAATKIAIVRHISHLFEINGNLNFALMKIRLLIIDMNTDPIIPHNIASTIYAMYCMSNAIFKTFVGWNIAVG